MPKHRRSIVHRGPLVNRGPIANIVTRRAFDARKRELNTRGMPLCKISTQSLARIISKGLRDLQQTHNYGPLRIANKSKHTRKSTNRSK